METVQMTIGGRPMLLSVKQADHARRIQEKNRARAREIERELKQERLGPSCNTHNQFAGWMGTNGKDHIIPNELVKSSDQKFNEFLALNRSEVKSKSTF
jgi:hypothetical protein